jgi:hypothetical protein
MRSGRGGWEQSLGRGWGWGRCRGRGWVRDHGRGRSARGDGRTGGGLSYTYCRRRAPEQPAEAARRSLAADCESAGSKQCLLAAATWCQRWQSARATCVHAPAPPASPLSAESERAVAAAAVTGRRPLARRRARKTSSWAVLEEIGTCGWGAPHSMFFWQN